MMIKNAVKNAIAAGTVLCGLAMPAKADDITLSYDYIENASRAPCSVQRSGFIDGFNSYKQIRESDNHADFIQRANQAELSTEDKIALLSYLGGRAGDNYDDSNTFEKVSLDRIFGGIQTLVETGEITPSGAMCGGIHDFIRESAQGLGRFRV